MRSIEIRSKSWLFLDIDVVVSASIAKLSSEAKRTARIIRSASSPKRSSGLPTVLSRFFLISPVPSNKSTNTSPFGRHAMALIVKSRRFKSSSSETPKATESGRRASLYVPSWRYGVTSTTLRRVSSVVSFFTPTVPKSLLQNVSLNKASISSGIASVVTSQSLGIRPMSRSRTQPPTK